MNVDMSEIIEFVLPKKTEYASEHNHDDGGGYGDDDDADCNNQYVILDGVDGMGREFKHEEFLLISDNGDEGGMLINNAQLHQQLINCPELQHAMLRVPKDEYLETEQLADELEDLVEEETGMDSVVEDGELYDQQQYEQYDQQQYEQYEQYNDDDTEQDNKDFQWNYADNQGLETETETIENKLDAITKIALQTTPIKHDESDAFIEMDTSAADLSSDEAAQLAKPSEKNLDQFKGPRRYQLYDELIATIVDFDDDGTPIVEFRMIANTLDEKLPIECGICPDVMHKSKLAKHQRTHLVPGTNRYACIYCTETYRDCKYLAGHARRHMGIRPYVCEPCKLYFSTKQDLRVHNQRRHLKKEHICEMCGKTFAQNTQLKRHREATHEKKRRFQCAYCQKAYYKNFSLQEHIRNVHMGKRRMLKCPFCGMQCRDAHKMARHRKEMHLNQDTFVCHLCQEEFTDINYFDAHKRSIQCRSNTRRLVGENKSDRVAEDGFFNAESDELAGMLDDEFDEDAGLLTEANDTPSMGDAEADVDADVEGDVEADVDADAYTEEEQTQSNSEAILETTTDGNDGFIQEAEDEGDDDQQQQFVHQQQQQYDQNTYEDDGLLVEHIVEDEEQLVDEDEQFLLQLEQQELYQQHIQQQYQQQQQAIADQYNDDELIYEITLETEEI